MKLPRFVLPAAIAAALLTAFLARQGTAQPAGGSQAGPVRIAIANPARIFNEIRETKDLQAKFNTDLQTLNTQRQERELKIKDTRAARDALKGDSPQWADRNNELTKLAVEYKVWQELVQADLERQQKQQMRQIFDKITEEVGLVAKNRGVDLVIAEVKPDLPDDLGQLQTNELRARLVSRNVLFSNPSVDISQDVVAAMDAKYQGAR
jgi:Skp family chaperone for outer membrane proteins